MVSYNEPSNQMYQKSLVTIEEGLLSYCPGYLHVLHGCVPFMTLILGPPPPSPLADSHV